jgi:hypothetical protein
MHGRASMHPSMCMGLPFYIHHALLVTISDRTEYLRVCRPHQLGAQPHQRMTPPTAVSRNRRGVQVVKGGALAARWAEHPRASHLLEQQLSMKVSAPLGQSWHLESLRACPDHPWMVAVSATARTLPGIPVQMILCSHQCRKDHLLPWRRSSRD